MTNEEELWADLVANNPDLAAVKVETPEGEECPKGANCPSHYRVDGREYQPENAYAQFVTYIGEYCVVSGDNPEVEAAVEHEAVHMIFGSGDLPPLPPGYISVVMRVGDGTLAEIEDLEDQDYSGAVRCILKFDDFADFEIMHNMLVDKIRSESE